MNDYTKKGKSFEYTYSIPFPILPCLEITLTFGAYAGIGFYAGIEPDWRHLDFSLIFDIYAEAKVYLQIEGGFYIPNSKSNILTAFVVGLDGIIGHGRAGVKLEICMNNGEVNLDAYFIFNALVFQFYFQIQIKIDITFFKLDFQFDIVRLELFGFHVELHTLKKAKQEAFEKSNKWGVNSPVGIGILEPEPEDD